MNIGGDPEQIRAAARRLRSRADEMETGCLRTLTRRDLGWVSTAAHAFEDRLHQRAHEAHAACESVRAAASRMDRLADELAQRQLFVARLAAEAESGVEDLADQARSRLHELLGVVW